MSLEHLRKEIDELNAQIIERLEKRVQLAISIAQLKKQNVLPIEDQSREKQQYLDLKKIAEEHHLSFAIVEKVFSLIIDYSKEKMRESL